jgi:hypothetical protein
LRPQATLNSTLNTFQNFFFSADRCSLITLIIDCIHYRFEQMHRIVCKTLKYICLPFFYHEFTLIYDTNTDRNKQIKKKKILRKVHDQETITHFLFKTFVVSNNTTMEDFFSIFSLRCYFRFSRTFSRTKGNRKNISVCSDHGYYLCAFKVESL